MCYSEKDHKRMTSVEGFDPFEGPGSWNRMVLKKAHEKQDGKCIWCNRETYLWWEVTTEEFKSLGKLKQATREHMTPKSKGGENDEDNITCACHRCNSLRGTISVNQFTWVTSNPKRFKRLMQIKAAKKEKRALEKKERQERHKALMAEHARKREEKKKAKAAKRQERRDQQEADRLYNLAKKMQHSIRQDDINARKLRCQERQKKNQAKVLKLDLDERVKKHFAKVNLRTTSSSHVRNFCVLQ